MLVFDAFNHLVTGYVDLYRRARSERMLNDLPPEIQKDIGWRGFYPEDRPGRTVGANGQYDR